jgi:putative membrane protein
MKRSSGSARATCAVLVCCGLLVAASSGSANEAKIKLKGGPQAEILAAVIAVDRQEINVASQAERKQLSPVATDYARLLRTEHAANAGQAAQLAAKLSLKIANTPAVAQMQADGRREYAKLAGLHGLDYERAYLSGMVKDHTDALEKLDKQWLPKAKDPEVKAFLATTRKHVVMHLDKAKALDALLAKLTVKTN